MTRHQGLPFALGGADSVLPVSPPARRLRPVHHLFFQFANLCVQGVPGGELLWGCQFKNLLAITWRCLLLIGAARATSPSARHKGSVVEERHHRIEILLLERVVLVVVTLGARER